MNEIEKSGAMYVPRSCQQCGLPFGGPCKYEKGFNLDYETWIVVDTKNKCHGLVRHTVGTTLSEKQAEYEADYFNWSWQEPNRYKSVKVKISFEILK